MKRGVLVAVLGVAGACSSAGAFQLRCQWVRRIGGVDTPIPAGGLLLAPNEIANLRLQFGLFTDASGPPPAGGFLGWNVGTIDGTPATNAFDAARLAPFTFAPPPGFDGTQSPLHLSSIDNTLGPQTLAWNGVPGTNDPGLPPDARVRGANTFVSVFAVSVVQSFNAGFDVTAAGNAIAALSWNVIESTPPNPGADGIFGTPDDSPGNVIYAPTTLPPIAFSNCVCHIIGPASPGAATVLALGALVAARRRRSSLARVAAPGRERRDS